MAQRGLSESQAAASRRAHGDNTLSRRRRSTLWQQFLSNFGDPIIKILLTALALNLVFMFHHFDWYETAGIAAAIFLATFVSTLSEYGSESAFKKLQDQADAITCRVQRREGLKVLPIDDIVVGDTVLLQAGERIPADGILIEGHIQVDQSALSGEAAEIKKSPGGHGDPRDLLARDRLLRGALVTGGQGVMQVEVVGDQTFYGRLAQELQEETRESPLRLRLAHLAKILSRIGCAAAGVVALADLIHTFVIETGGSRDAIMTLFSQPATLFEAVLHAVTLAVTVVVVAVPEGLPMMITVVLSSNMRRMLKDHVLVRKLVGIETSGSLNILFTDKTGTLTRGRPVVVRAVTGDGKTYDKREPLSRQKALWDWIEKSCALNSDSSLSEGQPVGGNATDRALMQYVLPLSNRSSAIRRIPFDSDRKYACAALPSGRQILVKGAPEKLLPACTRFMDGDGHIRPLTAQHTLTALWRQMTTDSMRVIALILCDDGRMEAPFHDAVLIALIGISDPVRGTAAGAVRQVRAAGIQTVMVTGDNRETAIAIAREAGVLLPEEVENGVLTGQELSRLSDDQLRRRLPALRVVARALPSDKSRLVRLAQEAGLVVGMTGDGINDAPALKKADVGFAMGSGTEVAKEAGDIVILNDDFASIARAILYGRTIFKSIRKFIVFQLTMNLCAVGVSIIGPFIGIDTPVTVMQMLWINIIMDTLAGLAFAGEPPLPEYMEEKPKGLKTPVLNRTMLGQILWDGGFTVALCVAFLKLPVFARFFRSNAGSVYFLSAFFALFIFTGICNSFNARTERINLLAHLRQNRAFIVIMLLVAMVQLLIIYYGGSLFRTAPLTVFELRRILALSLLILPVDLIRKLAVCCRRRGDP